MWREKGAGIEQAAPRVGLKQWQSLDGHWGLIVEFVNFGLPILKFLHKEAVQKLVIFFP